MNVNGLTDEQRRLKANLVRHRDGLYAMIKRMQALSWFSDDAMLQTILAARHALHAAVNSFTPAKPSGVCRFDPPAWTGYPKSINYPPNAAGGSLSREAPIEQHRQPDATLPQLLVDRIARMVNIRFIKPWSGTPLYATFTATVCDSLAQSSTVPSFNCFACSLVISWFNSIA